LFVFFFFFSSRRRHTRSKRDWSSDVCSSDLLLYEFCRDVLLFQAPGPCDKFDEIFKKCSDDLEKVISEEASQYGEQSTLPRVFRSEERRVGKESRSRWLAGQEKKKRKDSKNR